MTPSSPRSAEQGSSRRLGPLLSLLAFASLIVGIDVYIVVVALPEIGRELVFSEQTLQLVISAYALAFGGLLLLGGRLSDLLGRRRMLALGLALYAVSSLAGGLTSSPELLLAARTVQGVGGALVYPATLALISALFAEGPERNRALSVWSGAGAGGLVLGSLLGGVLTQAFGWEAIFFVNVPLAGLALLLTFPLIPPDGARETGRNFDLAGALTGTIGLTLLVFALVQGPEWGWTSPGIVVSLAAGLLLLASFLAIERRSRDPLVPLGLFRNRNLSAAAAITFMHLATFGSLLYFLTIYFQSVLGYSALQTGLAFLLPTAFIVMGSAIGGQLATRFGLRATLTASLAIGSAGALATGLAFASDGSYPALITGLILLSVGDGIVYTTMFIAAGTGVSERESGIASGIASVGTQVGSAVGLAVLVAIANSGTEGLAGEALRVATTDGLRIGVFAAAAGIAATILIALSIKKPQPSTDPASEAPAITHLPEPTTTPSGPSASTARPAISNAGCR